MKSNKEVTIYDLARALNVSPSTVSRGLSDHPAIKPETKKRIQQLAKEMGYQFNTFASNLRKKRTNTIGVILPRFNSYFMSSVIAGMEKQANKARYNLIVSQSQESMSKEIASVNTMFNSRIDGLMVSLAYDTIHLDHFNTFFAKEIPVIFFDRVINHPNCTSIIIDNYNAAYKATAHLIEQGSRRIIHVGGCLKCHVYKERFRGYKQALEDNDIPFDKKLVFNTLLNDETSSETAHTILGMNTLPDGIFTANDTSAVTIMCELLNNGVQIPKDIAVVGFNNNPISRVINPNLTTIQYPGYEMGEMAASTLINKLKNPGGASLDTIVLNHKLIIRESSLRKG